MRILALQLKRIGDLVLTTPALRMLRRNVPEPHVVLGVSESCASLLPAIGEADSFVIFGSGRGFAPWQQVSTGRFDACLDFTGTDRSALATALTRAQTRATFGSVRRSRLRALAYNRFVESPVRDWHTSDHYLHLLGALGIEFQDIPLPVVGAGDWEPPARLDRISKAAAESPELALPSSAHAEVDHLLTQHGISPPFVVIHPGTARSEKFWLPERWAAVIRHIENSHQLPCVITGGSDAAERGHIAQIQRACAEPCLDFVGKLNLLQFAALIEKCSACLSSDTAAVHLAAAFKKPQLVLFGPTNPFHWRPRHARAHVISAAQPDALLTSFEARMKGAPMERISTDAVVRATDAVLAAIHDPA